MPEAIWTVKSCGRPCGKTCGNSAPKRTIPRRRIARLLGVTRPTYTYYETGKTTPSVTDLYQLSRLYHRAMEEFFQ